MIYAMAKSRQQQVVRALSMSSVLVELVEWSARHSIGERARVATMKCYFGLCGSVGQRPADPTCSIWQRKKRVIKVLEMIDEQRQLAMIETTTT